jgi:hypothetical protein
MRLIGEARITAAGHARQPCGKALAAGLTWRHSASFFFVVIIRVRPDGLLGTHSALRSDQTHPLLDTGAA